MDDITWSIDEEMFGIDTKEEAIIQLYESFYYDLVSPNSFPTILGGQVIHYGTSRKPRASSFVNIDRLLEDMGEMAYDEHGEFAEDFPNCTTDAVKELEKLVYEWADKHCTVDFYAVENVQSYTITEEDVKELFTETGEYK